jgi:HlyD family secretion protein
MVAVPVVLAGAVTIGGSSGSIYRTASVERADLDATLDSVGTIQPINQANLSFPVAGTVHSVSAALGQHVTVGQTLAQLDTTSLDAQVASAQSAVAIAQARLAADQSSQTVTAAVAPTAFSTQIASGASAPSPGTSAPDPSSAARDLVTQQQALLIADQHRADQDITQEKRDLTNENSLCQAFVTSAQNGTRAPSSQRSRPAVSTTQQQTTPPTSDASPCESAIATVLADQTAVEGDQHALSADLPALSAAIDKLMATTRDNNHNQLTPLRTPQPSPTPQPLPTPQSPQTSKAPQTPRVQQTPQPPWPRTTTASAPRPASAEQLASDQAAIDAAQAQLTEAQQARNQAELRSPIDGTVGSLTISAGQLVQGSSDTPQIVVIGPGAHQVTTSVTDTNVGSLRVGEAATVIPSGGGAPLAGQVVSIGLLVSPGSAGSAGSVSYPVTIGLTSSDDQLFPGQSASVSITLAHASGTLTVPSSAVHHLGTNNVVSVLRNGIPSNVIVTLGAMSPTRTQVITGLNPGDQVILADLSQHLPTTGVQNIRRITGGSGVRPGG